MLLGSGGAGAVMIIKQNIFTKLGFFTIFNEGWKKKREGRK